MVESICGPRILIVRRIFGVPGTIGGDLVNIRGLHDDKELIDGAGSNDFRSGCVRLSGAYSQGEWQSGRRVDKGSG